MPDMQMFRLTHSWWRAPLLPRWASTFQMLDRLFFFLRFVQGSAVTEKSGNVSRRPPLPVGILFRKLSRLSCIFVKSSLEGLMKGTPTKPEISGGRRDVCIVLRE